MLTLSDFGVAFRPEDKSRFVSYTPLILRPPEAYHGPETPLTFASDIWSLGCVIFELLSTCPLIHSLIPQPDSVTAELLDMLGPMPPAWWERWEARSKYDHKVRLLNGLAKPEELRRRFQYSVQNPRQKQETDTLAEDELDAVLSLFKAMLAWSPADRPDISEVLSSTWMTKWALPAYQKCLEARQVLEGQKGLDKQKELEGHGALRGQEGPKGWKDLVRQKGSEKQEILQAHVTLPCPRSSSTGVFRPGWHCTV
ncbi:hypothetical protein E4U34_000132 [Claviceps purpurea]|nr:hypothetical protein E4U34_000132 [Claviceps purpurea]